MLDGCLVDTRVARMPRYVLRAFQTYMTARRIADSRLLPVVVAPQPPWAV